MILNSSQCTWRCRQHHLNSLIKFKGVVTRRTGVFPQLQIVKFNCTRCSYLVGPFFQNTENEIRVGACPSCQSTGPFEVPICPMFRQRPVNALGAGLNMCTAPLSHLWCKCHRQQSACMHISPISDRLAGCVCSLPTQGSLDHIHKDRYASCTCVVNKF